MIDHNMRNINMWNTGNRRKVPNGNLTGEIPLILAGLSSLQHL